VRVKGEERTHYFWWISYERNVWRFKSYYNVNHSDMWILN